MIQVTHHSIKITLPPGWLVLGWVEGGPIDPRPSDFFAYYEDEAGKEMDDTMFEIPDPKDLLTLLSIAHKKGVV